MIQKLWEKLVTALVQTLVGLGVLAILLATIFGVWAAVHIITFFLRPILGPLIDKLLG